MSGDRRVPLKAKWSEEDGAELGGLPASAASVRARRARISGDERGEASPGGALAGCGKITVLDGSNKKTASRLARLSPRWATGAGSPPRPSHAAGTSRLSRTRL